MLCKRKPPRLQSVSHCSFSFYNLHLSAQNRRQFRRGLFIFSTYITKIEQCQEKFGEKFGDWVIVLVDDHHRPAAAEGDGVALFQFDGFVAGAAVDGAVFRGDGLFGVVHKFLRFKYSTIWLLGLYLNQSYNGGSLMGNAVSILSGIAAAAAGLAGEKTAKDGSVAGLDIGSIVGSLVSGATGSTSSSSGGGILSGLKSVASKVGLGSVVSSLAGSALTKAAGSLLGGTTEAAAAAKSDSGAGGVAGLASAILGGTGSASSLSSIASLASGLIGGKSDSAVTKIAGQLGTALSDSGLSLNLPGAASTALKGLTSSLGDDTKSTLFTSILKKLV
jgi:hypothetical protein